MTTVLEKSLLDLHPRELKGMMADIPTLPASSTVKPARFNPNATISRMGASSSTMSIRLELMCCSHVRAPP